MAAGGSLVAAQVVGVHVIGLIDFGRHEPALLVPKIGLRLVADRLLDLDLISENLVLILVLFLYDYKLTHGITLQIVGILVVDDVNFSTRRSAREFGIRDQLSFDHALSVGRLRSDLLDVLHVLALEDSFLHQDWLVDIGSERLAADLGVVKVDVL